MVKESPLKVWGIVILQNVWNSVFNILPQTGSGADNSYRKSI